MTSVSTDRRLGVNSGAALKVPCRAASTGNLTLSGEQTIDGIACVTGDRVLVKNQTSGAQNGIYIVDTGTWGRAPDWDGAYDVVTGTAVYITSGSSNSGTYWAVTTTGTITVGTTSVAFTNAVISSAGSISFVQSGTGAATRSVQEKEREIVSITDYLNTNGTQVSTALADNSSGIGRAIAAAAAIYVPLGTFTVAATNDLPAKSVTICGPGTLHTASNLPNGIFRRQDRGYRFEMEGLTFTGASIAFYYNALDLPAGPLPFAAQYFEYSIRSCMFLQAATTEAIYLYGSREGNVIDCYFTLNKGIFAQYAIECRMYACDFKDCARQFYGSTGTEGTKAFGGSSLGAAIAYEFLQNAGVQLVGILSDYQDQNIVVRGTTEFSATGCYLGTRTSNPAIETLSSGGVRCKRISITGCPSIVTNYNNAVSYALIIRNADDVVVKGNHIWNWQANGFECSDITGLICDGNTIQPKSGTGTYSVNVSSGDSATNAIRFNVVGKPINFSSAKVYGNSGFVTENSGTDTIASGTTSKAVTHGLAVTPSLSDITVNFTQNPTNDPGHRWLSGASSTQFTVNVRADPGVSNLTFAWRKNPSM